ncbi:UrcA family protein [Sphingomicrobium marinum]|uniref:UrcA family protein n=1 Tax=Sphingomicrobium marinum TaxID=1227950 RepID=UPI0022403899|nr:UrcA family protein [Sphingomicrobium marinum]
MTKTMMMAAGAMLVASPVLAAEPVEVRVAIHDLDLTSVDGRKALEQRARQAASDHCGTRSASDLKSGDAVKACREEVVAKVMRAARGTALASR